MQVQLTVHLTVSLFKDNSELCRLQFSLSEINDSCTELSILSYAHHPILKLVDDDVRADVFKIFFKYLHSHIKWDLTAYVSFVICIRGGDINDKDWTESFSISRLWNAVCTYCKSIDIFSDHHCLRLSDCQDCWLNNCSHFLRIVHWACSYCSSQCDFFFVRTGTVHLVSLIE